MGPCDSMLIGASSRRIKDPGPFSVDETECLVYVASERSGCGFGGCDVPFVCGAQPYRL